MQTASRIPALRQGNYLFVEAQLAGRRLLLCIDSGAGIHVLTPDAAIRLGLLPTDAKVQSVTGTAATVTARRIRLEKLSLGGVVLTDSDAVTVALPSALGGDGLLGYPLFTQFVVTLDYATATVTLTPPAAFRPATDAVSVPLRLVGNIPQVELRFDEFSAWVELDTGSSGEIDLNTPFVEKNRLRERYPKRLAMPTGVGVGGVTYGEAVRIEKLQLGPFTLNKPVLRLSQQTRGADASSQVGGRLGAEILSRFRVTFDYGNKCLYLTPNAHFSDPFVFSRSGLLPLREGGDWIVFDVLPDSPASDAGVRAGDQLLMVGERAAYKLTAYTLHELLRRPPGTRLPLLLRAPTGRTRRVTLTLRELL